MFNFFKKQPKQDTQANASIKDIQVNTSKEDTQKYQLDLQKRKNTLEVVLTKIAPDLKGIKMEVEIVIDHSGSMSGLYGNGTVQETIERIVPVAMRFDDNMSLGCHAFNDELFELEDITLSNYVGYVNNVIERKTNWGGTNYAPFVNKMIKKHKKASKDRPVFVTVITDGDNYDKHETTKAIIEASKYNIFFKFIGIGSERFAYLEQLDDMEGGTRDNVDFQKINSLSRISDEQLYEILMVEISDWLKTL